MLDDGPMEGATGAAGATGSATGVAVARVGRTGAAGAAATATANSAAAMDAVANVVATLPEDATGAASTGTPTVNVSTGEGIKGATIYKGRSTATAAMIVTATAGTNLTTGTSSQADNTD